MSTDFDQQPQQGNAAEPQLLKQLLLCYLPFWPLFVIFIIASLTIAFFSLRYTDPIYQVTAKLLLKESKKGMDEGKIMSALNMGDDKKVIENETVILRSWPLMKEVVNKLHLYSTQSHPGKFRNIETYGVDAPLQIIALNVDSIHALPKPIPVTISWKKGQFILQDKAYRFGDTVILNQTKYSVAANPNIYPSEWASRTDEKIVLQITDPFKLSLQLAAAIKMEPSAKQSTVLEVTMPTSVIAKGTDIVNTLFTVYNEAGLSDKNLIAKRTLDFVDERLALVTKELQVVENNIRDYKISSGIVDMSAQGKLFLETVQTDDIKVNALDVQLLVLKDVEKYVSGKGQNTGTVPSLIGIADPTLGILLNKLYEGEMQLAKTVKITGVQNDQQVQLRAELASMKVDILENIHNIRDNFTIAKNNLQQNIAHSSTLLNSIPGKEKALIQISREQVIKNSIYSYLLQKREETALSYASAVADSRVVEPAIGSTLPIKPVPNVIYLTALAAGIGLVVLVIFFLESLNNTILFRTEIEQKIKSPIIGELMFDKEKAAFVVKEGKRTILAEQFRMLRTNLAYLGVNTGNKVIQVSSSISGEGKSYVASNLAIALSLTGKTVVLMELDLRKPKISVAFGLSRDIGVTDYLVGLKTLEQIIKPAPGTKGLSIISCGVIPPNPSELIGSDAFKQLIENLKNRFDYIVFDTAPVSLVSDAFLLAAYADSTVYVVRHGYTPKTYLDFIHQLEKDKKLKQLSIVFNGLKPRGMQYGYGKGYGNGYGYGNSYGYGYGEYAETTFESK